MTATRRRIIGGMVPVALLLASSWVLSQPAAVDTRRLLGQSEQTAKRLAEAEKTLAAGKAADALEQVLRIQDEAGDDLVTSDGKHFRPARRVAQQILVKLPPEVLRTYRDRVAGPADALLAAGTRDRDPRPLRTLLDRYFPAAAAEPALLLLGELLFERGEFRAAETHWRRLLPNDSPAADPSVPTPTADPARVRALVALAALFQGESTRAWAEIATLRKEHPKAAGRLAGVEGVYADTLMKHGTPRRPLPAGDGDWTGFAGGPSRDGRATGRLPRYWPSRATWRTLLPTEGEKPSVIPTPTARSVAYHPVVLGGVGYVADPLRVFAFDPLTGALAVAFDLRREPRFQALPIESGVSVPTADADFTLTAAGGHLYGRFGLFPPAGSPDPMARPADFLVCLTPTSGKSELAVRWQESPPARDGAVVAWEAAPVVRAGRVYAAFTRLDGTTRTYAVAAYTDPPGDQPLWVTEVATAPAGAGPRVRQEPLTLAGDRLVYCTHAGSVVALDTATGKLAWAVRYPQPQSQRKTPAPKPPRDLQPPLAAGGRVFVAPADAELLLALDANTGRELWAADGLAVDQLLGVSRGRLVATLAGPQKGIRGFDAATGGDRGPAGWRQHDDPHLGSFGRGLVTDDLVLWPTKQGLFPLDPETGRLVTPPLPGPHGNLAFAGGVLLVGTPTGVAGFVPNRLRPDGSPRSRAAALADAGRVEEAVALVKAAGLPDADRLAEWWRPPPERPAFTGRPLVVPPSAEPLPRFDPVTFAPLGPDVAASGVTRFPLPMIPLRPFDDGPTLPGLADRDPLLLVTDGTSVLAYRPGGSRPIWTTKLPAGVAVTRAVVTAGDIIAAGPGAVVRLDRTDGRLVWAYTPPSAPRAGPRPVWPPLPPVLAEFTLAGSRLCCRLGGHTLLGIDLADGRLAWARDGLFPRLDPVPVPSAPGFTHLTCPDGRRLLARRTDGKLLVLEPVHGEVVGVVPTAAVRWDGPPVWLGGKLVAVADGPDRVTALDLDKCQPAWTANTGGDYGSLWGKPPQLRSAGGGLLIATARTHGTELGYVRRPDGSQWPSWPDEPVFLSSGPVDLSAADADADAVYIPTESELLAVRLADGAVVWRTPLPDRGRWRVRCGSRAVLLVPEAATAREPFPAVAVRSGRRFLRNPHAGRLPVLLFGLYDAWAGRTVPVVRLDPATGRTLGRLDLPAAGPACGVHLGPGPAVVATATAAHWLD